MFTGSVIRAAFYVIGDADVPALQAKDEMVWEIAVKDAPSHIDTETSQRSPTYRSWQSCESNN